MLIITESIIKAFTVYFFWKVIVTKPKEETDFYCKHDDEKR